MIMYLNNYQHKKIFIIVSANKWYNILSEDLTQPYLHMDKLEVEKLIQCLVIYMQMIKKLKELCHKL